MISIALWVAGYVLLSGESLIRCSGPGLSPSVVARLQCIRVRWTLTPEGMRKDDTFKQNHKKGEINQNETVRCH